MSPLSYTALAGGPAGAAGAMSVRTSHRGSMEIAFPSDVLEHRCIHRALPGRSRMKIPLALFWLAAGAPLAGAAPESFYLGTYTDHSGSKGIYAGTLDSMTGALGPLTLAASAVDPSFLALKPDGTALYTAEETPGAGAIGAWRRGTDGALSPLNQHSANGDGTCFVSIDPSGRDALIANYGSGSVACFRLRADGSVGDRTAFVPFTGSGPNHGRQQGPHAHCLLASPDGRFAYACDLGSDRLWVFRFDAATGKLVPDDPPAIQLGPGGGPRHLVFSREGKALYLASEMGHTVTVFSRDTFTGTLTPLQVISTLPPDAPASATTAEIVLHPNGKWLYVSNRGNDTITVFSIGAFDRLRRIESVPAGVQGPRSFAIDPGGRWLLVAGQNDNRLAVLRLDPQTGRLTVTTQATPAASPVCVLFVPES
jgi:6-phosphogluconolactonase